jgi:hypothetical protein
MRGPGWASISDNVRLRFRRSGGIFAGNRLDLDVDESELDDEAADALHHALEGDGLARFERLPSRGAGADEYQYDLTVQQGDDVHTLRFDESQVPSELAPLIYALERHAEK